MILLTGASGVVGCAIRAQMPAEHTIALSHNRTIVGERMPTVTGDITQPLLGLDCDVYKTLCSKLTAVIHSAAVVGLACRPERYEQVNMLGTRRVVRLAEDAKATLTHISTAFVSPPPKGQRYPATYEQSKWLADKIVGASSVPNTIIRPSIVIGDSHTGEIAEEQGIHQAVAKLVQGPVRVVPGDEDMVVDFVPQDHVAAVVTAATRLGALSDPLWVTSGAHALTVGQLVEVINEFLDAREISGERARAMPFEKVERLVIPILTPRLRAEMRSWLHLARHVSSARRFPCSSIEIERLFGLSLASPRAALQRNLDAWWRRRNDDACLEAVIR